MRPKFNYSSLQLPKRDWFLSLLETFLALWKQAEFFGKNGVRKILKRTPRLPRRQMSSYLGA